MRSVPVVTLASSVLDSSKTLSEVEPSLINTPLLYGRRVTTPEVLLPEFTVLPVGLRSSWSAVS